MIKLMKNTAYAIRNQLDKVFISLCCVTAKGNFDALVVLREQWLISYNNTFGWSTFVDELSQICQLFQGQVEASSSRSSLIGWTTRDLYRFIPNAFNFSVDSPVGKSASAETFKSLHCYPGKGITLFLDGSLVLFLGSERGFEQMWEFRLCKTINCFGCQVKLGTRAFCCFTNEPVFLLH